ncbi:shugoshin-1 [Cajanus cajan]|uniref:shugoshin-1 n=1 Tax=Cajanus cajan TaxID=3821 RepID=UPI00098D98D4|nr:shugoshin-1 [Cajanus cajan]
MAKKSIGSLMRKKLSDITNSTIPHSQQLDTFPSENNSIQQLLKERTALIQLLAERNKIIEVSGAALQRLRGDVKKLQLQNWNLAQSNSHPGASATSDETQPREMYRSDIEHTGSIQAAVYGLDGSVICRSD